MRMTMIRACCALLAALAVVVLVAQDLSPAYESPAYYSAAVQHLRSR